MAEQISPGIKRLLIGTLVFGATFAVYEGAGRFNERVDTVPVIGANAAAGSQASGSDSASEDRMDLVTVLPSHSGDRDPSSVSSLSSAFDEGRFRSLSQEPEKDQARGLSDSYSGSPNSASGVSEQDTNPAHALELDATSHNGAFINGTFYAIGEEVRVNGSESYGRLVHVGDDAVSLMRGRQEFTIK